jgi:hypothetical protein
LATPEGDGVIFRTGIQAHARDKDCVIIIMASFIYSVPQNATPKDMWGPGKKDHAGFIIKPFGGI